jgi:hypothetical protein
MPPDEAARITVSRKHADDVGDRQIIIAVDGDKIATLLFGQEVTRDLSLGPHRIKAHNTLFWKNLDLDLKAGEHALFRVVNRAGPASLSMLGILGVAPLYLTFERER